MQVIEFYYDFGSPNAYIVDQLLPDIAIGHSATIRYHPVLLGGLFKATGNQSPALAGVKGKMAYLRREIDRFVARHEVPFTFNPHFPIHSVALMRGAIFAQAKPWQATYRAAMFRHCWVEGTDMSDPKVILDVLHAEGLPAEDIVTAVKRPDIKAALFAITDSAVGRGVFGLPTMFVGPEMYFGKDSLIDLENHLQDIA
jgi:2-hydroxychromene-2-carboxylate isomerase